MTPQVRRFWIPPAALRTLGWDKGDVELVRAEDFDALQEELELQKLVTDAYKTKEGVSRGQVNNLRQRLTAAEQRNAALVELLRDIRDAPGGSQFNKHIDAALNPTESGASA
jgi:hypothetical protein